jgi:cell division protein FtsQ
MFTTNSFFHVQIFKISGISNLTERDVIFLSEIKMGSNIFYLDEKEIAKKIARSPFIKRVTVKKKLPSIVKIIISERKPVAYLNTKPLKLISSSGVLLPRPVNLPYPDLPMISTSNSKFMIKNGKIKNIKILEALTLLKELTLISQKINSIISEIILADNKIRIKLIGSGATMYLPKENRHEQLLALLYFLENKEINELLPNLAYIDLRFKDQIVIKKHDKAKDE